MSRPTRVAVAALAAMLTASGCGNAALTRDQYLARVTPALVAIDEVVSKEPPQNALDDYPALVAPLIPAERRLRELLVGIEPPAQIADVHDHLGDNAESFANVMQDATDAVETGDDRKAIDLIVKDGENFDRQLSLRRKLAAAGYPLSQKDLESRVRAPREDRAKAKKGR